MNISLPYNHSRMSDKLLKIFFEVETNHWWWIGRKKIVIKLLNKYLNYNKNIILDAGCGTGAGILYLKNFGTVYGIDLSPIAVKFCKQRGIKKIRTGDVSKLPYKNNFFDLVCLMDVIEHVSKDSLVIKEAYRILKPGGLLLTTIPALPFINSNHDYAQGHFRRYSKSHIEKILSERKFKNIKISYFNFFLSPIIILIRISSKHIRIFSKLADYDSKLNYEIYKKNIINQFLIKIISIESKIIEYFNLPFGISLITISQKNQNEFIKDH